MFRRGGELFGQVDEPVADPSTPPGEASAAVAQCGIARTRDLDTWERLPDLVSESPQQRNVVLHPEFVDGRYAFYTRPQEGFIETERIDGARLGPERIIDPKQYHTIKEAKNGAGPPPIRTPRGWLHVAHGVRGCAAGLRYVLYVFLCDLAEPWRVIRRPGGYFIAPRGAERLGDVSNVVFSNGAVARDDGTVFIYYASSDTRLHVATSTIERLLDYCENTPPDAGRSYACAEQRIDLADRNAETARRLGLDLGD